MAFVSWDASLSVNEPLLDAQHRDFIEALNRLHEVLITGRFQEVLHASEGALEQIERYVGEHFDAEEAYMARIGYPGLPDHHALHVQYASEVRGYRAAAAAGDQVLSSELVKTMIHWFEDHLRGEDRKYAAFAGGGAGR